ncbi:MAG: hypothetical protein LRY74_03210 [Shewanella xiamenensis]|nr:hypothetical protein [Shewanella xiamenensis]
MLQLISVLATLLACLLFYVTNKQQNYLQAPFLSGLGGYSPMLLPLPVYSVGSVSLPLAPRFLFG